MELENEGFLRLREASEVNKQEPSEQVERHYNYFDLFRYKYGKVGTQLAR
jgi:hypothetical protein